MVIDATDRFTRKQPDIREGDSPERVAVETKHTELNNRVSERLSKMMEGMDD